MVAAVRGSPPGAGRLPERPRNTSRIFSRRCHCCEFPARRHGAGAEGCAPASAHAPAEEPRSPPPEGRASRASAAGRGRAERGGATREGRAEENGGVVARRKVQGGGASIASKTASDGYRLFGRDR